MICYRDRTFCASPCATASCDRHNSNVPRDTNGLPVLWSYYHGDCESFTRVHAGDCDLCGEWSGGLVSGACVGCRGDDAHRVGT